MEHMNQVEERFKCVMEYSEKKMCECLLPKFSDLASRVRMELENFGKRLRRHNDIETRFLFPRAMEIEQNFAKSKKHDRVSHIH